MTKFIRYSKNKGDIADPKTGRDLTLSLALTMSNNKKEYTQVNSIIHEDPSLLSENEEQAQKWLEDTLVWSDVYTKKGEDYLEMVANGETPKWDKEAKKWVSQAQAEETIGAASAAAAEVPVDPQAEEEPDTEEDLPF